MQEIEKRIVLDITRATVSEPQRGGEKINFSIAPHPHVGHDDLPPGGKLKRIHRHGPFDEHNHISFRESLHEILHGIRGLFSFSHSFWLMGRRTATGKSW